MGEVKVTKGLKDKIGQSNLGSSIETIVKFKEVIDNLYSQDTMTPEMRESITKKLGNLIKIYEKLSKITNRHISNDEKAQKIEMLGEEIAQAKEEAFILLAGSLGKQDRSSNQNNNGSRIETMRKVLEETISKIKDERARTEEKMAQKVKDIIGAIKNDSKEALDNVNKYLQGCIEFEETKKEEVEDQNVKIKSNIKEYENPKEEKALIKKEDGFFKKIIAAFRDNPLFWEEVENKNGTVEFIDTDGKVMRTVTRDPNNPAAADEEIRKIKDSTLFSRLKAAFGRGNTDNKDSKEDAIYNGQLKIEENNKKIEQIKGKIENIKKQFNTIKDMSVKALEEAKDYADEKLSNFMDAATRPVNELKQAVAQIAAGVKEWGYTKGIEGATKKAERTKKELAGVNQKIAKLEEKKGKAEIKIKENENKMNEYADKKVKLQTRSAERSTEHKKRIPARRETVEAER